MYGKLVDGFGLSLLLIYILAFRIIVSMIYGLEGLRYKHTNKRTDRMAT